MTRRRPRRMSKTKHVNIEIPSCYYTNAIYPTHLEHLSIIIICTKYLILLLLDFFMLKSALIIRTGDYIFLIYLRPPSCIHILAR